MEEEIEQLQEEIKNLKKAVELLAEIVKQTHVMGCAYVDKTIHNILYKH